MKKIIITLLLGVVFLSGCGDKEAREYANKLIPVLDSYQEQISQKIKVEKESYKELADIYDEARKNEITTGLTYQRSRRSDAAGERMGGSGGNVTMSQILDSMQEYAKLDFETTKTLLQEDLDTRSQYLTNLESLEIELKKIKILKEALQELGKQKSDFKQFKQAADFIFQTDKEINKLHCADLKKQLDDLNDKLSEADAADKPELEKQIKQIEERMKTNKCS